VGGRCVFVDCASIDEYNPSWPQIEAAATKTTKAVIIAHTFGVPARDVELIAQKCKEMGWTLIEDISECVGIKTMTDNGPKLLGTFGDYACASMYANKVRTSLLISTKTTNFS
jgi:perosamine synthetase